MDFLSNFFQIIAKFFENQPVLALRLPNVQKSCSLDSVNLVNMGHRHVDVSNQSAVPLFVLNRQIKRV